ncbi:MAG: hypothetical protein AAF799_42875 [Myxococcota bacterium]
MPQELRDEIFGQQVGAYSVLGQIPLCDGSDTPRDEDYFVPWEEHSTTRVKLPEAPGEGAEVKTERLTGCSMVVVDTPEGKVAFHHDPNRHNPLNLEVEGDGLHYLPPDSDQWYPVDLETSMFNLDLEDSDYMENDVVMFIQSEQRENRGYYLQTTIDEGLASQIRAGVCDGGVSGFAGYDWSLKWDAGESRWERVIVTGTFTMSEPIRTKDDREEISEIKGASGSRFCCFRRRG